MTDIEELKSPKYDEKHIEIYENIIMSLIDFKNKRLTDTNQKKFKKEFNNKINTFLKKHKITGSKIILVKAYNNMIKQGKIENDVNFMQYLSKRPQRTASGVNSFAILLSPHPNGQMFSCEHNCYYCPDESRENGAENDVARSYLSKEPAVARGLRHKWDCFDQIMDRLLSLERQGHEVDKLEIIIEGGTYTEFPIDYLEEFHRDIFYTANTFWDELPRRSRKSMREEIEINWTARVKVIGICIETRPDAITDEWIKFFRDSGTTRIQLGVQHTDNYILKKINRGHSFEQSCIAVDKLKNNGFKVDIHLMPDLPYSTKEKDIGMFNIIYKSDLIQPDQIKIYPCEVVPWTVIKKQIDDGKYTLYSMINERDLLDVVRYGMEKCPPWMRIPRVVRDIPLHYISNGNPYPNLRQMITDELSDNNTSSNDIRAREITRHPHYKLEDAQIIVRKYKSGTGMEHFISMESPDEKVIFGFCRLRIPPIDHNPIFPVLKDKGLIRELHVYNKVVPVGINNRKTTTQHRGVGKKLVKTAEKISWEHNLNGVAVISGEGVRQYYWKLGYIDKETYCDKEFKYTYNIKMLDCFIAIFILYISFILYLTKYL